MNVTKWMPGVACGAKFTIGDIGAQMSCNIQLKDFAGNNLTGKNAIYIYYTTTADGNSGELCGATTVLATHGIIHSLIDKAFELLVTEDNGVVAITVDGDGVQDTYVNVILPFGQVVTSGVLAFNG